MKGVIISWNSMVLAFVFLMCCLTSSNVVLGSQSFLCSLPAASSVLSSCSSTGASAGTVSGGEPSLSEARTTSMMTREELYRRAVGLNSTLVGRNLWRQLPSIEDSDNIPVDPNIPEYGVAFFESGEQDLTLYGKTWDMWNYNSVWRFNTAEEEWEYLQDDDYSPGDDEDGARWFSYGTAVRHPTEPEEHAPFQVVWGGVGINGFTNGLPNADYLSSIRVYYAEADGGQGEFRSSSLNFPSSQSRINTRAVQDGEYLYTFAGCHGGEDGRRDLRRWDITWPSDYDWDSSPPTIGNPTFMPFEFADLDDLYCDVGVSECFSRCGHSFSLMDYEETLPSTNNTVRRHYLIVYGGHWVQGFLSDMWYYDLDDEEWSLQTIEGAKPDTRAYQATVTVGSVMIIYGGDGPSIDHYSDMWAYFARDSRWIFIDQRGEFGVDRPERRAQQAMTYLTAHNALVVYGGTANTPTGENKLLTDVWAFGLGCRNDCSGNGTCIEQVICACNDCFGGPDCSVSLCREEVIDNSNRRSTTETAGEVIWPIIVGIIGGILLVLAIALLIAAAIMIMFRVWRRNKQRRDAQIQSKGQSPAAPQEEL